MAVGGALAGVEPLIVEVHSLIEREVPYIVFSDEVGMLKSLRTKVESSCLCYDYLISGPEIDNVCHLRTQSGV